MEAKDTVLNYNYRVMIGLKDKGLDENLKAQAEISFKVGYEQALKDNKLNKQSSKSKEG